MKFWLGVENFAKIESAKVNIDDYTLFVGQNNSGKTFLMQLIQGISEEIVDLVDESFMVELDCHRDKLYTSYRISSENIGQLVKNINEKLDQEKGHIIKGIFGKYIPIEKLYIDLSVGEDEIYEIVSFINSEEAKKQVEKDLGISLGFMNLVLNVIKKCSILLNGDIEKKKILSVSFSSLENKIDIFKYALEYIFENSSLFLPASRTGLMLLYRDFFANKADQIFSYKRREDLFTMDEIPYGNLTYPMYGFLRFLQTYTEDNARKEAYRDELSFFEDNLIEGHINIDKQGFFSYSPQNDDRDMQMYLVSSMINEIAPIALAVISQRRYDRLIIDEIEASLHPEKQLELVRFLNRLHNKGMKLILSTHSDTFVSKVNNLYLLSEYIENSNDLDVIKQFGLEKEDLLVPGRLYIYEFVNQSNGKSIVREVKRNKGTGFQFDQFTDSALRLYDEALKIGEIQKNAKS